MYNIQLDDRFLRSPTHKYLQAHIHNEQKT